jgi:iron complex outermembrane receptor protein
MSRRNQEWPILALLATVNAVAESAAPTAAPSDRSMPPIVVTATRTAQPVFDLPVSIDRVEADALQGEQRMVNLSESLVRVPGVVAQNRQNYAQDLQISIRGFGARSTFGVRGMRLYTDGIPATMPDGQGQVSHFDLGSAEAVEVIRGPFSALYGNSSGGVIALFTENGRPGLKVTGDALAGSYGERRYGIKASGQQASINHMLSSAYFATDGYRVHSAANRSTVNAKLRIALDSESMLTIVGNGVRMHDVQDPLGLTRAQYHADPRGVDASAIAFNTRKSVDQGQIGLRYERTLGPNDDINAMVYGGHRTTTQFQAIPISAQVAPTSAGGVIDLGRSFRGVDLRWTRRATLGGKPLELVGGIAYDRLDEERRGFENFVGASLGVQGRIRRNESNIVSNVDQYLQAQWQPDARWLVVAGLRNSNVVVRSNDHYVVPGNGDDSGGVRYRAVNPVVGTTFKFSPALNLYASYGKGFETPTLTELSYRSTSGAIAGLNFGLNPARSVNFEVGAKLRLDQHLRANLALFHIDTTDELTVLANAGGRAVFQNAGKTRRDGLELSLDGNWSNGISAHCAYAFLRALYVDSFCSGPCSDATRVAAGNRLPGVPAQNLYGELAWRYAPTGFSAAIEGRYSSKVFVDDLNSDAAAGYFMANLRAAFEQRFGPWHLIQFARIDNIANRNTVGSVIVNESNRRYFEAAPMRNYLLGVRAAYVW